MSTEATGGQPGADGAVEPEAAAAEETEPAATTLAAPTAWDTAAPSAWGSTAASTEGAEPGALVPEQPAALDETAGEVGDDAVAEDALVPAEPSPAAEGDPSMASEASAAETGAAVLDEVSPAAAEPGKSDDPSEPSQPAEPSDAAEALELHGSEVPAENDESDETEGSAEVREPDEAGESDEVDEADDPDGAAYDEDYDYSESEAAAGGEEYGDYEPAAAAEPQRARRWPRVLLALGFVVLAAVIVGGAIAIVGSVTHGFKKPVKITYKQSALFSLKTGECFNPQGQSYSLISCDSPHQAEVFATFSLSGTNYPGATAIATQASDGCTRRLTGYVNPQLALSLTSTYVYPDSVAWQAGTRTVICEVRASTGTLTGSVRSATASS
jgi:hypothetical protein